jgi:hypothetical protein
MNITPLAPIRRFRGEPAFADLATKPGEKCRLVAGGSLLGSLLVE